MIRLILLSIFVIITSGVDGQNEINKSNRVELDIGVLNNAHRNTPTTFVWCIEGCTSIEQEGKLGLNLALAYYHSITNNSSINIGVGYNQIRFNDKIEGGLGGVYETAYEMNNIVLTLGHRYNFFNGKKISSYINNNLNFNCLVSQENFEYSKGPFLNSVNISYQLGVGFLLKLNNKLDLNIKGNYNLALSKYNATEHSEDLNVKYLPYQYGVSIGLSKVL